MKKRIGIMSCNIYCNFTNYGSALQTYALQKAVNSISPADLEAVVMDYCPDTMLDKDILNPFKHMWDKDDQARKMCELTLPAIKVNNDKFNEFYKKNYNLSHKYTSKNFSPTVARENISGYVVGSDTVFCLEEFNFDRGYFADYPEMKGNTFSYAASFGDSHFTPESLKRLDALLQNFNALGIREEKMLPYIKNKVSVVAEKTIDPTLLLKAEDYYDITTEPPYYGSYLLIYARRYSAGMEKYARELASKKGLKIVEISLRATNSELGHIMRYDAGVEEFLGLVKNAAVVITNSFHGMIFAVQFRRPFVAFSRDQCSSKIQELLDIFGLEDKLLTKENIPEPEVNDYDEVHRRIDTYRKSSLSFLEKEIRKYL